ncbi:hypothetical protein BpHYR1_002677 [Brachionus plicatilis]|uniref:Uncharacterized protein n=1 Tax=Brachionus plicatilis TaxID=10195 RepID=A0A3M7R8V8_BRAPC|nr:hypothetical protein BpHYR1_002677 [Brachionus plicatilis]
MLIKCCNFMKTINTHFEFALPVRELYEMQISYLIFQNLKNFINQFLLFGLQNRFVFCGAKKALFSFEIKI